MKVVSKRLARRPKARRGANAEEFTYANLETRQVLNGVPVANPDPFYVMTSGSSLVVTTGDGVISNDFDAEGSALTATRVTGTGNGPFNGTITFSSNGSFTYPPNSSFVGFDSFRYTVSDGTNPSEVAVATISVKQTFSGNLLQDERGPNNILHSGALTQYLPISPSERLVYRSDTVDPRPIIAVESLYNGPPAGTTLTSIVAQLYRDGGLDGAAVTYNQGVNPLAAGTKLRFALQSVNSQNLPPVCTTGP